MTTLVLASLHHRYLPPLQHPYKHRSPAPALLVHEGSLDEILALLLDLE
jgi:hypothetical protein